MVNKVKSEQVLRVLLTFGGKPQQISEGKEERLLENLELIHLTFNLSLAGGKQQRIFDCSFQKDGRGTLFALPHSTGRIAPNLITDGLTEVIPPFGYVPLA